MFGIKTPGQSMLGTTGGSDWSRVESSVFPASLARVSESIVGNQKKNEGFVSICQTSLGKDSSPAGEIPRGPGVMSTSTAQC